MCGASAAKKAPDCDSGHYSDRWQQADVKLCRGSQTVTRPGRNLEPMSAKYYTQFKLTDGDYHGGNEFSGVVELSRPMAQDTDVTDIEAVLAKNFDLQQSAVQLVSWSRLH